MNASCIQPQVQRMIDRPGIYICTTEQMPIHAIVIFSSGGKLIVMQTDKELDPTRFNEGLVVKYGPLSPLDAAPPGEIGPESPDKGAEPGGVDQVGTTRPLSESTPVRAAQAGWKLVPVEPTDAMLEQLGMSFDSCRAGEPYKRRGEAEARKAYADVLAVTPSGEPLMADEELILGQLKRIGELEAEVQRLELLVYVPGLWRCAKCKVSVHSQVLNVVKGSVYANQDPQQCPNQCGPMWRVTERDAGNELADHMNDVRNVTLDQVQKLVMSYVKSPKATVVHFLGKVDADIREAELAPKRAAAADIVKLIETLKGPA